MSPVSTRAKRKQSTFSRQLDDHKKTPRRGHDVVNPNKRRLVSVHNESFASSQLSSDILHQILSYFVSDIGVVDVETIRSVMLVSKLWNEVSTSCSMWSIPQRQCQHADPIRNALYFSNSGVTTCSDQQVEETLSLIGFAKLEEIDGGFVDDSSVFRAIERSSRTPCIICVSPKGQKPDVLLNHIFEVNFFQGSFGCKSPSKNGRMTQKQNKQNEYFLGVLELGGHVVRWYEDCDVAAMIRSPVFSPSSSEIILRDRETESRETLSHNKHLKLNYGHLQGLERSHTKPISDYLSRRSWAMIVDWLIEITMCFCLDSRIPFHAMDLLRQFISCMEGGLTRGKYQLLASACMQIATKCNMANMRPADFRYCSDNLFTVEELCDAEAMVLGVLQWKLAHPTIIDFIHAFTEHSDIGRESSEARMIAYLADLALQSYIHVELNASQIAACIVVLARFGLSIPGQPLWKKAYVQLTGYTFDQVCDGVVALSRRLDEIRLLVPNLRVIDKRHLPNLTIPSVASTAVLKSYQTKMTQDDPSH